MKALRHREKQLFGTHYDVHEDTSAPWDHDSELAHNKHYEPMHRPHHSKLEWPTHHQEHDYLDSYRHDLVRDHDIVEYHMAADADGLHDDDLELDAWYRQYEDPHMHAPLTHHKAHELIDRDERRPSEGDFYEFSWEQLHDKPLRETHLEPMHEHGDYKDHHTKKESSHHGKKKEDKQPATTAPKPAEK